MYCTTGIKIFFVVLLCFAWLNRFEYSVLLESIQELASSYNSLKSLWILLPAKNRDPMSHQVNAGTVQYCTIGTQQLDFFDNCQCNPKLWMWMWMWMWMWIWMYIAARVLCTCQCHASSRFVWNPFVNKINETHSSWMCLFLQKLGALEN